mmetsp:Transcript_8677/g.18992  ORF Transcript_8677/g.18992 Transcript_8677/m.18992 type:complete len:495 (+) Transcript_8677:52-1536(+)
MATMDVELFECQRYRPLAGWSADYLLPTDMNTWRVRGCKTTWRTLPEAEEALLAPGWSWEELSDANGVPLGWEVDYTGQVCDAEGWAYATSFSSRFEGAAKGGLQRFTRWRRMLRTQTFRGEVALLQAISAEAQRPTGCPHLDLAAVGEVSTMLLEAIVACSLNTECSLPTLVSLKKQLVERLSKGKKTTLDATLGDFVASSRGVSTWLAGVFKGASEEVVLSRMEDVRASCPIAELEALAAVAIRRFMPEMTCSAEEVEHECRLRALLCPYTGCRERFSSYALAGHDSVCTFKPVACEKCKEEVPRGQLVVHSAVACPMREATCTYSTVGCEVALRQRELPSHLDDCTQSHMMMLLQALVEQQELVKSLVGRVRDLEQRNANGDGDRMALATLSAKVQDLEARLTSVERQAPQDLQKVVDAAADTERKAAAAREDARKKVDGIATELRKEINSVKKEMGSLSSSANDQRRLLAGLPALAERLGALETTRTAQT